ncbi:MAG TPA: hypothetical protein PKY82_10825 [Pyrinomonadaceae bacterium]|nr:hypothetical protein [Pyrinomonadaceae bacterium]
MNNQFQPIFILIFLIIAFVSPAFTQTENSGELNVWTNKKVSREKGNKNIGFRGVRVTKQKDFDSVVFEFKGKIPNWEIEYGKPPILIIETGIYTKIAGKAFVKINFFPVSDNEIYDPKEKVKNYAMEISPKKLKLFFVKEIINTLWVNDELSFAVGVKSKTFFRAQELANPTRLEIDFKH